MNKFKDPSITNYVTTGTEPAGVAVFGNSALGLPAGGQAVFTTILNDPALVTQRSALSKWECLFSVYIGTDADEDFAWPGFVGPNGAVGGSLSSDEKKIRVTSQFDWGTSIDTLNCRVHNLIVHNTTAGSLDIYAYRKFYTTTASTGV